jgi:hypothetical protein
MPVMEAEYLGNAVEKEASSKLSPQSICFR